MEDGRKAALVQGAEMAMTAGGWVEEGRGVKSKGEASGGCVEIQTHHGSMPAMEARLRFWSIQEVWKII